MKLDVLLLLTAALGVAVYFIFRLARGRRGPAHELWVDASDDNGGDDSGGDDADVDVDID